MKLTAVTAVYNVIAAGNRDALIRCVESVAKLKTEHEHLIYDGASTDGTVELLRKLETKTLGLKVVSEPDTGIYNALNKGVRDAKGEWFYVLGCDDCILSPDIMDEILSQNEAMCNEIVTPVKTHDGVREITTDRIFRSTPYGHQGTIVQTSTVRRLGGFDERYRICADYDLMLKIHETSCRIKYINRVFAYFDGRGVSFQERSTTINEQAAIAGTHFHSTPDRMLKARFGCRPPAHIYLPYLFHADDALRRNSRIGFARSLVWPLILLRRLFRKACSRHEDTK